MRSNFWSSRGGTANVGTRDQESLPEPQWKPGDFIAIFSPGNMSQTSQTSFRGSTGTSYGRLATIAEGLNRRSHNEEHSWRLIAVNGNFEVSRSRRIHLNLAYRKCKSSVAPRSFVSVRLDSSHPQNPFWLSSPSHHSKFRSWSSVKPHG